MSQWEDVPEPEDSAWGQPDPIADDSAGWGNPAEDTYYPPPSNDHDDADPFGAVEEVDALVYSENIQSPELMWQQNGPSLAPPPVRERPQPRPHQREELWKPGPDPQPASAGASPMLFRVLAMTLIPLALVGGLGLVVYQIMQAYGF
jgi:hypothetical protein